MNIEKVKTVLTEIQLIWKQKVPIQGHLLFENHSQADYKISLTLPYDKDCVECSKPIIEKHGLAMKQSEGHLIIY